MIPTWAMVLSSGPGSLLELVRLVFILFLSIIIIIIRVTFFPHLLFITAICALKMRRLVSGMDTQFTLLKAACLRSWE